jgi:hypothetical protein
MRRFLVLLIAVMLLSPVAVMAQANGYLGASLGASFQNTSVQDVSGNNFDLDGEEFAWKIFAGIRAARVLGIEGDYRDFGKVQNTVGTINVESATTAWDLFLTGTMPLGPLEAFGKAGVVWWRSDAKIDQNPFDVNGSDFAWGLGAAINFGGMAIRAEFERFELGGDDNLMMLTAGISFGS